MCGRLYSWWVYYHGEKQAQKGRKIKVSLIGVEVESKFLVRTGEVGEDCVLVHTNLKAKAKPRRLRLAAACPIRDDGGV